MPGTWPGLLQKCIFCEHRQLRLVLSLPEFARICPKLPEFARICFRICHMYGVSMTCRWWAGGDVQGHGVVSTPTFCCAPPTIMHAHSVRKPVATKQLHICQAGQQAVAEACRVVVAVNFRNRTSEPRTILGARLLPRGFRNCGGELVTDPRYSCLMQHEVCAIARLHASITLQKVSRPVPSSANANSGVVFAVTVLKKARPRSRNNAVGLLWAWKRTATPLRTAAKNAGAPAGSSPGKSGARTSTWSLQHIAQGKPAHQG